MILHEKTAFGPTKLMIHMGNAGKEDREAIRRLIPEEVVHAYSVTGTPEMAADRITEFIDAGLEVPVLALRGTAEERKKALRLLADGLASNP